MNTTSDAATSPDRIVMLEREALERWGRGDPGGWLDVYADDITYFDPATEMRIQGQRAMEEYYHPWIGKIAIARYEMRNPQVVVDGTMALLCYNLVNYIRNEQGAETVGSRWNSTSVYQQRRGTWKMIHSHWSYTSHPAFQNLTPEATEGVQA